MGSHPICRKMRIPSSELSLFGRESLLLDRCVPHPVGSASAPCSQFCTTELRFRRPSTSLFGRTRILPSGDYRACRHR